MLFDAFRGWRLVDWVLGATCLILLGTIGVTRSPPSALTGAEFQERVERLASHHRLLSVAVHQLVQDINSMYAQLETLEKALDGPSSQLNKDGPKGGNAVRDELWAQFASEAAEIERLMRAKCDAHAADVEAARLGHLAEA